MPRDVMGAAARRDLLIEVARHLLDDLIEVKLGGLELGEEELVSEHKEAWVLISRSADHHPINLLKVLEGLVPARDPTIDLDEELGVSALELIDLGVAERGDVAVFFWAEPREPGLASVDAKAITTSLGDPLDKLEHVLILVALIHADAVLDRHGQAGGALHGDDAVRDALRPKHKARTKTAALHSIAWAAHVEVDLIVAPVLSEASAAREGLWVVPTELQRERPLLC
jgi:hypothetical protein